MVRLPIVPKTERTPGSDSLTANGVELPLFYMSDFSVMGLWVSDCKSAIRILQERFPITMGAYHAEIFVDGTPGIIEVVETLKSAGIDSGVGDIVDQVYQG
jgi:hypothetical protein